MAFAANLDHAGISVMPDQFEQTIDWYSSKLDFSVTERFQAAGMDFAFLVGGDLKLEIIAGATKLSPSPSEDVPATLTPGRLHHLCLAVQDLDESIDALRSRGVVLLSGPTETAAQRFAFIADNVGNIIEITEPGTWPADQRKVA